MPKATRLIWTELDKGRSRPWHTAKDASGTVYRIRPVNYTSGKFAGYRITVGDVPIRGFKTTLHDAKASAQRFANRQFRLAFNKVKTNIIRQVDLDVGLTEIVRPSLSRRLIDLG